MEWTSIRYVKQQNSYSCGPIAVLNSLKWAGAAVTYAYHYSQLVKDCRSRSEEADDDGTSVGNFDRVLRKYSADFFTVRKPRICTFEEFEAHLLEGGAAVLRFWHNEGGHFSFFPEYDSTSGVFLGINDAVNQTFAECSKSEIQARFKQEGEGREAYPQMWLLTRKTK